uniref:Uncharacterized protein n=1 Tax=Siphoviridae sp. ctDuC3 TaxID=2827563 RepID=A0A8S5LN33_9CAUD|nr:MAG TPA: hypothetical protein [Siphoviridae sp. ctDuC3]
MVIATAAAPTAAAAVAAIGANLPRASFIFEELDWAVESTSSSPFSNPFNSAFACAVSAFMPIRKKPKSNNISPPYYVNCLRKAALSGSTCFNSQHFCRKSCPSWDSLSFRRVASERSVAKVRVSISIASEIDTPNFSYTIE